MVFDKQFFLRNQQLLRWFSNTKYGKDLLGHGLDKVDLILPNAVYQKLDKNRYKTEFRTHDKYTKRLFYEYKPIWRAFHWFDMNVANVYIPRLNLGFDTLTAFPAAGANSPVDGKVYREISSETFGTIRAGAGTHSPETDANSHVAGLEASTTTNRYIRLWRSIYCFDTSTLTDSTTISAVTFSVYVTAGDDSLGSPTYDVVAATPAATNILANADYGQLGTTVFADLTSANMGGGAYRDFSLDSNGIDNINKTGISKFGIRTGWDTDNSFGGAWSSTAATYRTAYFADQTGTANDPKLVVTYTLPGGFFYMST